MEDIERRIEKQREKEQTKKMETYNWDLNDYKDKFVYDCLIWFKETHLRFDYWVYYNKNYKQYIWVDDNFIDFKFVIRNMDKNSNVDYDGLGFRIVGNNEEISYIDKPTVYPGFFFWDRYEEIRVWHINSVEMFIQIIDSIYKRVTEFD